VREYETTFIIQPELSEEGVAQLCTRLEEVLEKTGASKLFYDDMGKRRLAYSIKTFQKGHYLTIFYLDEGKASAELERALRLDDSVLRFLTVLGNPNVADVEARKAEAVELERVRAEKAAERAQRDAEDAARAVAEEAERQAALTAQSEAAAEAREGAAGEAAANADAETAPATAETAPAPAETAPATVDAAPAVAEAPPPTAEPDAASDVVKEEG
jgi:small subunit ribosomal protein S6